MTTLRQIIETLAADGDEWLDAELTIRVYDGHRNMDILTPKADLWQLPRSRAVEATGEPARLSISVHLGDYRLVKERAGR